MCMVCSHAQVLFLFSREKLQAARPELRLFLKLLQNEAGWLTQRRVNSDKKKYGSRIGAADLRRFERGVAAGRSPTRLRYPNCGIQDARLWCATLPGNTDRRRALVDAAIVDSGASRPAARLASGGAR